MAEAVPSRPVSSLSSPLPATDTRKHPVGASASTSASRGHYHDVACPWCPSRSQPRHASLTASKRGQEIPGNMITNGTVFRLPACVLIEESDQPHASGLEWCGVVCRERQAGLSRTARHLPHNTYSLCLCSREYSTHTSTQVAAGCWL